MDTGASDHMTSNHTLFANFKPLNKPNRVTLPDGTLQHVTQTGHVPLNQAIILNKVLHVPEFKYNLLFIGKLLSDHKFCAIFYPNQ